MSIEQLRPKDKDSTVNNDPLQDEEDEEGERENVEEDDIDEEGIEGDCAYTFRFEGEMDPLAFTEDDAFGIQPYQQFERLEHEYEVLAEKKRKTLAAPCDQNSERPIKKPRQGDITGSSLEEMMELMNYGMPRKSRKSKKKGRKKGSKNKSSPEVTRKLGEATLHYAHGRYEEAIRVLKEVVLIAPNLPDSYHTFGLVYDAMGDKKKSMDFYMLAAHLNPKDSSLWKLLVTWSIEQGNAGQAGYCLSKAIRAEPGDINLRVRRASMHIEIGEYQKAAESYEQIARLCPENVEALKTAVKLYQRCGQKERSASILEEYLRNHPDEVDLHMVDLLATIFIESKEYNKALQHIDEAKHKYCGEKECPLNLTIKAGICYLHLGDTVKAETIFSILLQENMHDHLHLVYEVADSLNALKSHQSALKYYMVLEENGGENNGFLHLRVAHCLLELKEKERAIDYFYKALHAIEDNVDARLTLASLLEQDGEEVISLLSPPTVSGLELNGLVRDDSNPWWLNGRIKLKLSYIYKARGMTEAFVDTIYPSVRESLLVETIRQKVKSRKRLSRKVLSERVKLLNDSQHDNVFQGFRPVASTSDISRAARAKRVLQKRSMAKEAEKAAALAAGHEWRSDDSDDDLPHAAKEPPLPKLLKDEEHYHLIIDLCKGLTSLQRYWEAIEVINLTLKLASNVLSTEKAEELRTLGAQIAYNITDPTHGWDYARHVVNQHPHSFAAWNCYYKVISRLEGRFSKHKKFLHGFRGKYKDSIPPIMIYGHQSTTISHHQDAARDYLEAYKLMPDSPLINLCVGSALISLALGHRLQNKHQCLLQGLAFLYNNLRLCKSSQESLYNLGRAYHHVGLVTLAASCYEKVLEIREKNYPIPMLPGANPEISGNQKECCCDLRREAAYNLHLIYKKSGALDLARQVLKDHCTL